jgi:hypothetical protein
VIIAFEDIIVQAFGSKFRKIADNGKTDAVIREFPA